MSAVQNPTPHIGQHSRHLAYDTDSVYTASRGRMTSPQDIRSILQIQNKTQKLKHIPL
jgi:hypothetical protein